MRWDSCGKRRVAPGPIAGSRDGGSGMDPIVLSAQSSSTGAWFQGLQQVGAGGAPGSPPASSAMGEPSSLAQTAISVQSKVDMLLQSIEPSLGADQQLRMIIALLILNALLGRNDERSGGGAELAGLASGLDTLGSRRTECAMFSATNIIQIQHQSTLVYTEQAVHSIGDEAGGGGSSDAPRLDVTG